MSFNAYETSRADGRPFHLYTFSCGPTETWRFTNLTTPFNFAGLTYEPLPITHGEVVSSGNLDKTALEIRLPESGAIPDLFRDENPSAVVSLIIRQGHVADDDFKVHWAGKVVGTSYEDDQMVLTGEPISTSLRRSGLTRDFQITCPLVLYGPDCRANRAAATVQRAVVAVDGPVLTFAPDWAAPEMKDHYVGGVAQWTTPAGRLVRRSIVRRDGDTHIVLSSDSGNLAPGTNVSLTLGCNKTQDTCRSVFSNILNYGGQPEIPLVNPVGITNNYY